MRSKAVADVSGSESTRTGSLYLVGTPIGNLEDITLRAMRTLREMDLVACEDTRLTQKLLNHYEIKTRTTSYHEHNERTKAAELVLRLQKGARIALVSDAGMPAISDPGYRLVQLCIQHKIPVIPIPGPTAIVSAVVASGLPTHAFQFVGFPPVKRNLRRKFFEELASYPSTSIFFESSHRIMETLAGVLEVLGDRQIVLGREITKLHEEFLRGTCSEVLETVRGRPRLPGEMTVLIEGASKSIASAAVSQPLSERVDQLMKEGKLGRMDAIKAVARERKISKSQVYREYKP
ncbi:MAG: 16S rRNA (cytidine(1402)-2'-O)-methyltransferase [Acidobacteria bacterium]|nr:16S rRNA (cytidine(1402)-2'-O)-methyltransferase [Acidobacteriota bacterium]